MCRIGYRAVAGTVESANGFNDSKGPEVFCLNWMAVDKLLMRIVWYVFCAHVMRRELHTARHHQI